MRLVRINGMKSEYRTIKKTYMESFPDNERAPFFILTAKAKRRFVDFYSIYDEDKWIGFFYVVKKNKLAYIFYFAIDSCERGKGYGTKALKKLASCYEGYRLFLAIEEVTDNAPNYSQRVKRMEFYKNCGFVGINSKVHEGSVVYDLMGYSNIPDMTVSAKEYQELMHMWAGPFLRKIFKMEVD